MGPLVKEKNIGSIESILRSIIGVILVIFALIIEGPLGWLAGLIGIAIVVTATFGY